MTESTWKNRWDDPENPVVDTHYMGFGTTINIRKRDISLGKTLGMNPGKLAVARQPIGLGVAAFDLADPPDKNCITQPDGSCVGTGCMHDQEPA